jgi:DNA-binding NarL/FixJ family response regulator
MRRMVASVFWRRKLVGKRSSPKFRPLFDTHEGELGENSTMMNTIRLLLVDDEPAIRRGLRMRLALESDVEVVGEAVDGLAALDSVRILTPQVVVMDVEMPGLNGIDATRALRAQFPRTAVVVLSMHDDIDTQTRALEAGASAFVAKHSIDRALLEAIRSAAHASEGVP